jgi:hypothetical protein
VPGPSDPEAAGSVEAAREVVACAERTLAAPSARIELRQELRLGQADWPRPPGWRGSVLRLAVKTGGLLMRAWWRLATRRGPNRDLAFGQMLGEGFAEPARGRYMIDFGSRAKLYAGGKTFWGRSGRSVEAARPLRGGLRVGEVLWLLRLLPGTTDASPNGTETIRGTACLPQVHRAHGHGTDRDRRRGRTAPAPGRPVRRTAGGAGHGLDRRPARPASPVRGCPPERRRATLDLWEFGVPVGGLDWSRLPTFRSPGYEQERRPWYQRVVRR